MDEQVDRYLHDQRVATLIVEGMPPINPSPTTLAAQARFREAAQHHRRIATYHQLLSSLPRTTPTNPQAQPTPWSDPPYENYIDSSRHAPSEYTISDIHTFVRPQRSPDSPSEPAPSDGEDESSRSSSMPSLIEDSSDEDDPHNRDPAISDDARNAVNRRYA